MACEACRELRRVALESLDFQLVGVTDAAPLSGAATLRHWLADGCHGEMSYLADTAATREDPRRFLPGARSVLCVAMSYRDEGCAAPAQGIRIARYMRRADYHRVMRRRLIALGHRLTTLFPGAAFRVAVDTAPLLERELAARAGLGWIGRNTCLINQALGSDVFLGELVTDALLCPDDPASAHCGRCAACVDACPTAALAASGGLDARRCISYLTIEHRSELPTWAAGRLEGWLAGCDICQDVCPWNRHTRPSCSPPLSQRPTLSRLDGDELATLDESGYRRLAVGTPLRRIDFPRFRRNLAALQAPAGSPGLTNAVPGGIKRPPEG